MKAAHSRASSISYQVLCRQAQGHPQRAPLSPLAASGDAFVICATPGRRNQINKGESPNGAQTSEAFSPKNTRASRQENPRHLGESSR
jgi:hypothetical protein